MKIKENELLKNYTTLYIGGPAKKMVEPENLEDMQQALENIKENGERVFILGNGSNVLFADEGFDGTIVHIPETFNAMELLPDNQVRVQAGAGNYEFAKFLADNGLSGYEFACGVPGSIGGAIVMNAGCYNGETKDVLKSVRYLDENGILQEKAAEDLELGYRHSWFTDHFGLIVDAIYQLEQGNPEEIQAKMDDLQQKRYAKQPMEAHSCGSTFKRPQGHFASALIDQAGLRGYGHNDARVSEKHTGFLINAGNCTAAQFNELIAEVQQIVLDKFGVQLECEVKQIPYKE